jgi:Ca2+-binding EF-hand superfamily protein
MLTNHCFRRLVASFTCLFAFTFSSVSIAAENMVSFATGGYAGSLRSEELMKKMSDGTGLLTKDQWVAFHEKIFTMLDKKHTGVIGAEEYVSATGGDVVTFATGGYARGLRSKEMMVKIDTDRDGTISHAEFMAYLSKVFDMMDTSAAHKGTLTKEEVMFATGGYSTSP